MVSQIARCFVIQGSAPRDTLPRTSLRSAPDFDMALFYSAGHGTSRDEHDQ